MPEHSFFSPVVKTLFVAGRFSDCSIARDKKVIDRLHLIFAVNFLCAPKININRAVLFLLSGSRSG